MVANHTPGPWKIRASGSAVGVNYSIVGSKKNGLVNILHGNDCHSTETRATTEEALANACLIAAAPELLEALKGVVRVADRATDEFDAARAAIAKATGGKP